MQNIQEETSQEDWECLPSCAWLFLAIAFVPILTALSGQAFLTKLALSICFPVSMGPFAFIHLYIVESRLGFDSHMVWISALLFSMAWFPLFRWLLSKDKIKTILLCAFCVFVFAGSVWLW